MPIFSNIVVTININKESRQKVKLAEVAPTIGLVAQIEHNMQRIRFDAALHLQSRGGCDYGDKPIISIATLTVIRSLQPWCWHAEEI